MTFERETHRRIQGELKPSLNFLGYVFWSMVSDTETSIRLVVFYSL